MAANILQDKYSNTKIIEVRARLNSNLRKEYELIKNREVNDYHHAIDGYLTILLDNICIKHILNYAVILYMMILRS